jgi:putative addiction module component (TIGR02574 family)
VSTLERLSGEVLLLEPAERIALLESVLQSLDAELSPHELTEEWRLEAERRSEELKSGAVKAVPWDAVRRQLFEGLDAAGRG